MAGIVESLNLGVGNTSIERNLGAYYQDISPAIVHLTDGVFGDIDKEGIPYTIRGKAKNYTPIATIQYGLMLFDLISKNCDTENNKNKLLSCINWLDERQEIFKDSIVWGTIKNVQYNLPEGWVSGMSQGQAISLYLRAYQLFEEEKYLETAKKIFNSFKYDYKDGGFKRIDNNGFIWFEEYPTSKPSYVLNGFIYSIWGILDLYRVTNKQDAKELWESCVGTLIANLHKYDIWYWSIYDQLKEQLVSYYYQKNVHIPIIKIMYELTGKEVFNKYAIKWEKNLNNPAHRIITKIMYRVQPRIKKFKQK